MRCTTLTWLVGGFVAAAFGAHLTAAASPPVVLVDEGHGEKFVVEAQGKLDLSKLASVVRAAGATLEVNRTALTAERLARADALVVSGAFAALSDAEIEAVMRFLDGGGRLAVMLHIPFPLTPLLRRLHVDFSNGVIHERQQLIGDEPLNFRVTALSPHPLTRRLDGFAVYGAWALINEDGTAAIIARTGPTAWVDLNGDGHLDAGDAVQAFGVAVAGQVGQGQFVVFGDDAIFQNEFLSNGNAVLAANLACWLVRGACQATGAT